MKDPSPFVSKRLDYIESTIISITGLGTGGRGTTIGAGAS